MSTRKVIFTGSRLFCIEVIFHVFVRRKRSPEQECWRNSWGQDDQKDELWTAFNSNYQYLMNNNLIESCTVSFRLWIGFIYE